MAGLSFLLGDNSSVNFFSSPIYFFLIGTFGSIAVEVGAAVSAAGRSDGKFPVKYHRLPFLGWRFVLAVAAGILALVFQAHSGLAALYIGISAPLILDRASKQIQPLNP